MGLSKFRILDSWLYDIMDVSTILRLQCWRVRWPKKGKSDDCKDANE
ncbi:hypothetical protein A2U01_0040757, partial [Trifolium medium]|nr:hypothetical protein [Trifolium medium]